MGLPAKQIEQFNAKVELIPFSDCHYWTGALNEAGYGVFGRHKAHRVSYELAKGPIPRINGRPAGLLHSCDNPMCVNPEHLRPGTQVENMADAAKRMPLGERHHNCKLKDADVAEVIRLIGEGVQTGDIAARFGVSKSRISMIRYGRVGINHPAHKLPLPTGRCDRRMEDRRVLALYRRASAGESPTALAREFGVKYSFVQDVKRGNTYSRLTNHRS